MTFPKFVVAGGVNTVLTYLLYLVLLRALPYTYAYTVTYVAGIALGYLLNALWVFKQVPSMRTAMTFPLTYLVNYLLALGLLWVLVEKLAVPKELGPLVVLALTTPLMYVLTRTIFTKAEK